MDCRTLRQKVYSGPNNEVVQLNVVTAYKSSELECHNFLMDNINRGIPRQTEYKE